MANPDNTMETLATLISVRKAYTGKLPFKDDSKKPYEKGGKKATQPYFNAWLNRLIVLNNELIPASGSGYSFFRANKKNQPIKQRTDETMNGRDLFMFTNGVISGPAAKPIPKNNPYKATFLPRLLSGEEEVIQVWVAKWSEWSPIPISKRKTNQNQNDCQTGKRASAATTIPPPIKITGLYPYFRKGISIKGETRRIPI